MSTQEKIFSAATQNANLLHSLANTDYAGPALKQHIVYVDDLKRQLSKNEKLLDHLASRTRAELKDHEKYRDSHIEKFAYKIGGRKEIFDAKASKEEKEYFDALTAEHRAKQEKAQLEADLHEAGRIMVDLEAVKKQHQRLQKQLDSLYNSIFEGPTPDVPGEDQQEQQMLHARAASDEAEYASRIEKQIVSILSESMNVLNVCLKDMTKALNASDLDMFNVGGILADVAERNALSRAQDGISKVHMLVNQANRLQPQVRPLGAVNIQEGDFTRDVLFDNIYSDYQFHKKIKEGNQQMLAASKHLAQQLEAAKQREQGWGGELERAKGKLEEARGELQRTRMDAFQMAQGLNTGAMGEISAAVV